MNRKLSVSLVALTAMGFAGAASAFDNPWEGDGAEVNVEIVVGEWGEVWSAIGTGQARDGDPAVSLEITNAAGIIPEGGIVEDTVNHVANVDYEVLVDIEGDIPEWTMFHVLADIQNRGEYNGVGQHDQAMADKIVTWRRDDGGYIGSQPGTPQLILSGTAGTSATSTEVDYAAEARHGLPEVTDGQDFQVIYTIAAQ
ncbi:MULTISPECIES: hypothetical protein [unclassified Halorhodospira]|uniref:hypothetical protein n=1 Tax=unclassified Halorhodospira TaxID=2626748 RepID=UPI001EE8FE48|nr:MULTISPECIES: hypothetical protein [unclassified Halorhodospira]MCG5541335.1 hypothetical protein [Halorhodospira sp. M39old]MCG5546909.1 hypothetical protein [Halorhodospira sp. M38]